MARTGLTITKLAVQISADDEVAHTLLCLKVSLPREADSKQSAQWSLFNHGSSRLAADPQIHALPLTPSARHQSDQIQTAALLLSLPPEPSRGAEQSRERPSIHVSPNGQISISLDLSTPRKRRDTSSPIPVSPGGSGRREFLVVLEFEQNVEEGRGWSKLAIPLPKCLDNVLRFQILPPRASSSASTGEVSIVTEPKILPVPPSTFSPRAKSGPTSNGKAVEEDGWEDGESLGPEDMDSESEEGGGNWLEGRFQSTETLHLEWSFASTTPQIPSLFIHPNWDPRHPSINVEYEATLSGPSIEAVLPDGWGWSEFHIEGEGLISWTCVDGEWWDPLLSSSSPTPDPDVSDVTDRPADDSFATIRSRRNIPPARIVPSLSRTSSGASLMRQPLPQPEQGLDEFSFELNSLPAPTTPMSLRKGSMLAQSVDKMGPPRVVLPRPAPGGMFEIGFAGEETSVRITGKLVLLTRTLLVSPSVPVVIPVFRSVDGDGRCHLSPNPSIIDVDHPPALTWVDQRGQPLRVIAATPVKGDIAVTVKHHRGAVQMTVTFPWPRRGAEVEMFIPSAEGVEVVKVEMRGRALPRAVVKRDGGVDVRIGKGDGVDGMCAVVLEMDEEWTLPIFAGAEGRMSVELLGKRWNAMDIRTNLTRHSPNSYSTPLPPKAPVFLTTTIKTPYVSQSPAPRYLPAVWTWSTLINIFMLYLLLSMAQQIQRLRTEVAFVNEEVKDLRMYGTKLDERVGQVSAAWETWEQSGRGRDSALDRNLNGGQHFREAGRCGTDDLPWNRDHQWDQSKETSPGRVVLGRTGWDWESWVRHPTVKSLSKSLSWVWHTVVWLVHA